MRSFAEPSSEMQVLNWWQTESLLKIESPTSIIIAAPSGSGKTELAKQILLHADGIFKQKPSKIMFCYNAWQKTYDDIQSQLPNIVFWKGIPSQEDFDYWATSNDHKILLLDDLMLETANKSSLADLFCVGSHHCNITVIYMIQNLYQKGIRTISLNCHYFILFRNNRDQLQIQNFGRQVFPGKLKFFMNAYDRATSKPYGYLLIDLSPHSDRNYQLRSNILPGQDTVVYQPAK